MSAAADAKSKSTEMEGVPAIAKNAFANDDTRTGSGYRNDSGGVHHDGEDILIVSPPEKKLCASCGILKAVPSFSSRQWKRRDEDGGKRRRRCVACKGKKEEDENKVEREEGKIGRVEKKKKKKRRCSKCCKKIKSTPERQPSSSEEPGVCSSCVAGGSRGGGEVTIALVTREESADAGAPGSTSTSGCDPPREVEERAASGPGSEADRGGYDDEDARGRGVNERRGAEGGGEDDERTTLDDDDEFASHAREWGEVFHAEEEDKGEEEQEESPSSAPPPPAPVRAPVCCKRCDACGRTKGRECFSCIMWDKRDLDVRWVIRGWIQGDKNWKHLSRRCKACVAREEGGRQRGATGASEGDDPASAAGDDNDNDGPDGSMDALEVLDGIHQGIEPKKTKSNWALVMKVNQFLHSRYLSSSMCGHPRLVDLVKDHPESFDLSKRGKSWYVRNKR